MELPDYITNDDISRLVTISLEEDLGGMANADNDITANLISENTQASATLITREDMIVCGIPWANETFKQVDPSLTIHWHVQDGDVLAANQPLLEVSGSARSILTAERTVMNFLQTLSSTATQTHRYASLLSKTATTLLDTRKTIPSLRMPQKYAVLCGGGKNHRLGLFDAFLIKENHIAACGSIQLAVTKARDIAPGKPVEVEVESIEELTQALEAKADIVMLDNFPLHQIQQAVEINQGKCKLEVSGNITDEDLQLLSATGVDYISSGALTKHVNAIDLSLRLSMGKPQ
ncbi:carboxylating nicotinate-nucleotide diphosphorylase [Alteromonas facilis]|uniref:carboxylating nicotinate-nucleotide diphosphorylase n=1 Tax=Alteromonas facilis TaxID=2048004 RepID=UPI000C28F938|nr:carboxylating nicotinate-nucleotide diphosphorylase [Alteromonas facilis]